MMNKKSVFLSVFMAIIIAGVGFLYLNFANIAKNLAEEIASDALGVKVSIASLDLSLQDKKVTVSGIKIANPAGYKERYAITMDAVAVSLNDASSDFVDFKDIRVDGTIVNLEVTEKGNNLADLKKRTTPKSAKEPSKDHPMRVIVRHIVISNSTLNPSVILVGKPVGSVQIPSVSLSGIGVRENGVLAKEAIAQILSKYISTAESKASTAGFFNGVDQVEKLIEGVGKEVKDIGKNIGNLFDR